MSSADSVEAGLASLRDLHQEIDREAAALAEVHAGRLVCRRGCSACCLDDLSVTRIEAEQIRRGHSELLRSGDPNPVGSCAFLDEDRACRIYQDRPSVCRSQGLPLRIIIENELDEIEERRDVCALNFENGPDLEMLPEEDCWLVGPHELRLTQLDDRTFGRGDDAGSERVALRDLFGRQSATNSADRPRHALPNTPKQ